MRIFWLLAALLLLLLLLITSQSMAAESRPNFVLVITDDQRHDAFGLVQKEQGERGRFPWFTTPNMDRLAGQGMRFRNAFVVNALCSPSRANFLTGRYSHHNGVVNNHTPFPASNVTHASALKAAGYTTAYFGKWHCDAQRERPGFDRIATFVGQGRFINCPLLVDGKETPTKGWVDDVTTDYAIEFLRKQKGSDKPFDMVLGFKSPHGPRTPPQRAANHFAGETMRPVPNLDVRAPFRDGPEAQQNKRAAAAARAGGEGMLNYFRCISAVDDNLGRVLDALDELGMTENTVVVYTSDNGYFFGEHGLGDKRAAYEESIRVPLIVRYPKRIKPGTTSDAMVLNIDYAPTLLALAGVEVPKEMQGRSWTPLFEGKTDGWRQSFFYEYFFENRFAIPTTLAVRSATTKLVTYPGHDDWTELYDLASDPFEMKNLARDSAHAELLESMRKLYKRESEEVGYHVPPTADDPATAPKK
mgnify:CR=1 FL=1